MYDALNVYGVCHIDIMWDQCQGYMAHLHLNPFQQVTDQYTCTL